MNDATFEDGAEQPLRLKAEDAEDLQVLSAFVQDAVLPGSEISWQPKKRRFGMLLNRFRWEDKDRAEKRGRPVERVQTVLAVDDVLRVQSTGVTRDADTVLSVLSIGFEPGEDGSGRVEITLAGDGAIGLDVECLNLTLQDVTRPYLAPSHHTPSHD
ncbi:MAG: DUF2948 family protein [Dinoroseobacter sp.]|nr:DUF2948 family protein [Dinoroseobacter sp.]MDJ0994453.1 DUF2948 family protein [Dinoroseobacter sp.]